MNWQLSYISTFVWNWRVQFTTYSNIRMAYSIIFVLIFTLTAIYKVQCECDATFCTNVCQGKGFPAGNCNGNSCDCSYGKKCSAMITLTCKMACKRFDMDSSCLYDICVCRIPTKFCFPTECTQQCLDDKRAAECFAEGGFVTPFACWKYGDVRTCVCVCHIPATNNQLSRNSLADSYHYSVTSQLWLRAWNWMEIYNDLFGAHSVYANLDY